MKKIFYLLLLVVSFSSFGQQQYSSSNPISNWGPWSRSTCFGGIYFRTQKAYFNKSSNKWYWNWELQNRYNKKVAVSFRFYDSQNKDLFIDKDQTTGRATLAPNEIRSNGAFGREGTIDVLIQNLCFEFKNYNGTMLDNCSSDPATYKKDYYFAECDNGNPNYKKFSGSQTTQNNSSNSNQNGSNSNGNNTQSGNDNNSNSVDKTNNQIDRMNQYMEKIPDSDPEKTNINNEVNRITSNTNLTDSQRASQLNPLIDRAQRRASAIDSERNAKIEEGKRIQKENSAKIKKFDDTMKQGETALNNGKYDEAIGHFSQAYNIAPIEEARQMALQAIETAKKAKEDAARRVRIAEKQQQEQVTNDATTASLTAAIGLMVAMTDKISDGNFAAKFRFGVGMEQIPLVANVAKWKQVETATLLPTTFTFAFKTIFNNRGAFSIYAQPEIVLGLNAFQKGTSGGYISYGGMAGFQLGTSYKSKIKLFGEAGYFSRTGSYSYDLDVASGGTSATDRITEGEFKYNLLRFGGGIMFHFLNEDDDKEVIIKPAYYLEKLSFAPDSKPTGVFGLSISGLKLGQFDVLYSKNYAIGGKADYPTYWIIAAAPAYDKNYYQIRYTRQIRLK